MSRQHPPLEVGPDILAAPYLREAEGGAMFWIAIGVLLALRAVDLCWMWAKHRLKLILIAAHVLK
jgi:hypothetical protein